MTYNRPFLEPYKGRESRHECPACHDKQSFVRYLDGDTGAVIHPTVGRCNHESGCSYHYTPKDYYRDNPDSNIKRNFSCTPKVEQPTPAAQEPGRIPKEYLTRSLGYNSKLVHFLCSIFDIYTMDSPTIVRLMSEYYLGCTKNGSVIFWLVDENNRIRGGKIMQYNPETGKRVREGAGAIDWVHSKLKKEKVLPEDFNSKPCLFGEHLLKRYPDKVVAVVEGEKSAVIGAACFPNLIWLACGGRSQLSADKLKVLKRRAVILFPDVDAYELWCEKASVLKSIGAKVMVSGALEKSATQADREAKIDIADWLIRDLQNAALQPIIPDFTEEEKALNYLGTKNALVYSLIDCLGLVSASTGEPLRTQIN